MEPIWDFAQRTYAEPGFAEAALRLQDNHGADICVLLWLLWRDAQGSPATPAEIDQVEPRIGPWRRTVIEPLRTARRAMKNIPGAETLRARVQSLEIEAERTALERLAAITPASA